MRNYRTIRTEQLLKELQAISTIATLLEEDRHRAWKDEDFSVFVTFWTMIVKSDNSLVGTGTGTEARESLGRKWRHNDGRSAFMNEVRSFIREKDNSVNSLPFHVSSLGPLNFMACCRLEKIKELSKYLKTLPEAEEAVKLITNANANAKVKGILKQSLDSLEKAIKSEQEMGLSF